MKKLRREQKAASQQQYTSNDIIKREAYSQKAKEGKHK